MIQRRYTYLLTGCNNECDSFSIHYDSESDYISTELKQVISHAEITSIVHEKAQNTLIHPFLFGNNPLVYHPPIC